MEVPTHRSQARTALTSLILPAYNAEPRIERTWLEVSDFLSNAPGDWEVLFVCDGCTDNTPLLLDRLTRGERRRVRILSHQPNRGKGHAVRVGLRAARGRWRIFTDVDLAYGFDDILRLAAALRGGADVAIASRCHPDSRIVLPPRLQGYAFRRYLQGRLFSLLVRWLLPLPHQDTQAGLKGLSARAAEQVLPHLRCPGFEFDCELLTACSCLGLKVVEVPVCMRCEGSASTMTWRGLVRMVGALWQIRKDWRNRCPLATAEPLCGNPQSAIRNPKQIRNPNTQTKSDGALVGSLGIGSDSDLVRMADFEFRIAGAAGGFCGN
ncbi:MAG: glycosyltransferase [Gemmataceae bacterium]|nr:glycosyltransferase [Gemmataceae bacterium]